MRKSKTHVPGSENDAARRGGNGRPSGATVISIVALFVALSSSATAAMVVIKRPQQLGKNVVTSAKIKNRSIRNQDIKPRSIRLNRLTRGAGVGIRGRAGYGGLRGGSGDKGPQGDPGPAGVAVVRLIAAIKTTYSLSACDWLQPNGAYQPEGGDLPSLRLVDKGICEMTFGDMSEVKWATAVPFGDRTSTEAWTNVSVTVTPANPSSSTPAKVTIYMNYLLAEGPHDGRAMVTVYQQPKEG